MPVPSPVSEPAPKRQAQCDFCASCHFCPVGRMPPAWRKQARPALRGQVFKKHQLIVDQGEQPQCLRVVKLGLLLVQRRGLDGLARPVGLLGRGYLPGLLSVSAQASTVRWEAVSAGALCEIHLPYLQGHGLLNDAFWAVMADFNAAAFAALADWGQVVRLRPLRAQMAAVLLLLAQHQSDDELLLPSQTVLAQLLNVTRESVSRTLGELKNAGVLERRAGQAHSRIRPEALRVFL